MCHDISTGLYQKLRGLTFVQLMILQVCDTKQTDGSDGLQIWRVADDILNGESRTADKGGTPLWVLGDVLTTPHLKNCTHKLYIKAKMVK